MHMYLCIICAYMPHACAHFMCYILTSCVMCARGMLRKHCLCNENNSCMTCASDMSCVHFTRHQHTSVLVRKILFCVRILALKHERKIVFFCVEAFVWILVTAGVPQRECALDVLATRIWYLMCLSVGDCPQKSFKRTEHVSVQNIAWNFCCLWKLMCSLHPPKFVSVTSFCEMIEFCMHICNRFSLKAGFLGDFSMNRAPTWLEKNFTNKQVAHCDERNADLRDSRFFSLSNLDRAFIRIYWMQAQKAVRNTLSWEE